MNKNVIIFMPSIEEGGVEKNLFIVSNYLQSKGLKISILTCNSEKKENFHKDVIFIGTKSKFWQNKNRLIKYFVCLFLLFINLIKKNKNTLVFAFQANIYAILVAKILNAKIVTRSNSSPQGWSKNYFKKKLYSLLIHLADDIMVNSIEFKKEFKKNFNLNAECIYNPFKKISLKLHKKKNNKHKNLKILSVGRLTDQKDHLTLLKATKLINFKLNPKITIIGKGVEYNYLQNFVMKNKLEKKVKLVGFKKNPYREIISTDILVLTSKFEGLPNILLEAQFFKKYIISTNCPTGPKEILLNGKAGDLIQVGNYKQLAQLINNFKKRKKLILKKIKTGTRNFDRFEYKLNCDKYYKFVNRNF